VLGGLGADTFDGGAGNDRLNLGADADSDLLVIEDGDGKDPILNFSAPTPNGECTYTGRDVLDVSGLLDGNGDPVNIWDAKFVTTGRAMLLSHSRTAKPSP